MTHPNGPAGSGPGGASGSSPKAPSVFEAAVAMALILAAHYAATGINPDLRPPSTVLSVAAVGIYLLSVFARYRRAS